MITRIIPGGALALGAALIVASTAGSAAQDATARPNTIAPGAPANASPANASSDASGPLNYRLDASASDVSARVPFFGLASKTARFPEMAGNVQIVPGEPEAAMIDVTFDARALEAPDEVTLNRLRGERFFWVDRYPTIRFVGSSLALTSPTRGTLTGELTARGVSNTETLDVVFERDPVRAGDQPVRFTGTMEIDRRDYGMRSYQLIVGNRVEITLNALMVRRQSVGD